MNSSGKSLTNRTRLMRLMDSQSAGRLVYISAPAGYGKTVLVKQWAGSCKLPYQVLPLDEYDNSHLYLCHRLCRAFSLLFPENDGLKWALSPDGMQAAPEALVLRAADALSVKDEGILIIDDLHVIQNPEALGIISTVIKRLPDSVRLIINSRNEMPDFLAGLWLKGEVASITAQDLKFNQDEIIQLWRHHKLPMTGKQAGEVLSSTGGWAIGLNSLILSGGSEPQSITTDRLEDFLWKNVWEHWDEDTREFMLKTAVVKGLTAGLCNAVTGRTDSGDILRRLTEEGAFLSVEDGGVYRFHHLFNAFLQKLAFGRGEGFVGESLRRAGGWYLQHKDFYNAVDCFLYAKDQEGVALCFASLHDFGRDSFIVDDMIHISKSDIMKDILDKYPILTSLVAWAACCESRNAESEYWLDRYYEKYERTEGADWMMDRDIFYAKLMDYRVNLQAFIKTIELPAVTTAFRPSTSMTMNLPFIHNGVRDFSEYSEDWVTDRLAMERKLAQAKDVLGFLFGDEADMFCHNVLAGLYYERGELDEAYAHALSAMAQTDTHFATESKFSSMSILLLITDSLGKHSEAESLMEKISRLIEPHREISIKNNFEALAAWMSIKKGNREAAAAWLAKHAPVPVEKSAFIRRHIDFTTAIAYISVGEYDKAVYLLTKLLQMCENHRRTIDKIYVHVLLAIAFYHKKRNFQRVALEHLEAAVVMGYPFGFVQAAQEFSTVLVAMLQKLYNKAVQQPLDGVVPAGHVKVMLMNAEHRAEKITGFLPDPTPRPEGFTGRQKEIMRLIAGGSSFREIAEALDIKISTVRSHIELIYKKLDAANNADAIKKIKDMEL